MKQKRARLAGLNLSQAIAEPYSISDTSGGDRRIHAVRRIALAARALQYDISMTENVALGFVGGHSVSELSSTDLERIATQLEGLVDDLHS